MMIQLRVGQLIRQAAMALATAAVLLASLPASASAHASFLDSSPAPGLRLGTGPAQIRLHFTEPLNSQLSSARLLDTSSGDRIPAQTSISGSRLVLQPETRLGKGVYRVEWHSVSSEDGHALEGSFGFGVRVTPTGAAEQSVEQSPLAGDGWLRIVARWAMYGLLFLFAGGVINGAILAPRRRPGAWLVPAAASSEGSGVAADRAYPSPERLWGRTVAVGWLALAAAVTSVLLDAADASGGMSPHDLSAYLLTNGSGLARVAMVGALASAVFAAARVLPYAAATSAVLSFGAVAFAGHANSGDPRSLAIATDWLHLVAAAIWIGGIAQLAWAWLPRLKRLSSAARLVVMRSVLARFGRVALPAFLVVVASGLGNALIELGHPAALWETGYGRVLAVKIGLVALIAVASYSHALRLRPRLLASNPHPSASLERRHWRLLGSEPWLGLGAIAAVAVLVAFPLPPRQLGTVATAEDASPCEPFCPLPNASEVQLSVATHDGPDIAAFWLQQEEGEVVGTMRLLDLDLRPVAASVEVDGHDQRPCASGSTGCWEISGTPRAGELVSTITDAEGTHEVSVPASWDEERNAVARRWLRRAQGAMRELRSVRMRESVSSGLGESFRTNYRFQAPDRMEYRTEKGAHLIAIKKTSWQSLHGSPYKKQPFGGPGPNGGMVVDQFFRWTVYGRSVRLLGESKHRVSLALYDQATPIWYRLTIDRATGHVVRERMITEAHYMTRRWFDFNRAGRIVPPQ